MAIQRFLVVDEDEKHLQFFKDVLQSMGYQKVATTTTGGIALTLAQSTRPEFVICAWKMLFMPSRNLIQRLRRTLGNPYIPFLVTSAKITTEDNKLLHELGIQDSLNSPFQKAMATTVIAAMVENEAKLDTVEIILRQIEDHLQKGRPQRALRLFVPRLREEGLHRPRALVAEAEAWFLIGNLPRAQAPMDAVLALDPGYVPALLLRAKMDARRGRVAEAVKAVEALIVASPYNLNLRNVLASMHIDSDDWDRARQTIDGLNSLDPGNPMVREQNGKLAFAKGDLSAAQALLAGAEDPEELARFFNNRAIALSRGDAVNRAIDTYKYAIKLLQSQSKLHVIRYNLGLAFGKIGHLEESFDLLAQSYLAEPEYEKAYAAFARTVKLMIAQGVKRDLEVVRSVKAARAAFVAQHPSEEREEEIKAG